MQNNKDKLETDVDNKFPTLKPGESVFIGLTIDGKEIIEYELFRRYLLFVKTRAGIQKGPDRFNNKIAADILKELIDICPSSHISQMKL